MPLLLRLISRVCCLNSWWTNHLRRSFTGRILQSTKLSRRPKNSTTMKEKLNKCSQNERKRKSCRSKSKLLWCVWQTSHKGITYWDTTGDFFFFVTGATTTRPPWPQWQLLALCPVIYMQRIITTVTWTEVNYPHCLPVSQFAISFLRLSDPDVTDWNQVTRLLSPLRH